MTNNPLKILIHGTDASYKVIPDQFNAVNKWHKERDFPKSIRGFYIGYHRLFTGGKKYMCRDDDEEGAHCNQKWNGISLNFQSIGLAVGFDGDIESMPAMEYALLQKDVWDLQDRYRIADKDVHFHREWATNKTCPGSLITAKWLADLLKRPVATVIPPKPIEATCIAQETVIAEQKTIISNLRNLVAGLLRLFKT